eukprot:763558-Hanusia_phi.AAC.2
MHDLLSGFCAMKNKPLITSHTATPRLLESSRRKIALDRRSSTVEICQKLQPGRVTALPEGETRGAGTAAGGG